MRRARSDRPIHLRPDASASSDRSLCTLAHSKNDGPYRFAAAWTPLNTDEPYGPFFFPLLPFAPCWFFSSSSSGSAPAPRFSF
jgi:hypothetical protein